MSGTEACIIGPRDCSAFNICMPRPWLANGCPATTYTCTRSPDITKHSWELICHTDAGRVTVCHGHHSTNLHWPLSAAGILPSSYWASGLCHVFLLQECRRNGGAPDIAVSNVCPDSVGDVAKPPNIIQPKTPLGLPSANWDSDSPLWPGMRERERDHQHQAQSRTDNLLCCCANTYHRLCLYTATQC